MSSVDIFKFMKMFESRYEKAVSVSCGASKSKSWIWKVLTPPRDAQILYCTFND